MKTERLRLIDDYLRQTFQGKIRKISIDIGATCPNRDGSKGVGGCIFCSEQGSGSRNTWSQPDMVAQIEKGFNSFQKHYPDEKFIAYFQAFTPTYVPPARLQQAIELIACDERLSGFVISSRSDTLNSKVIDILQKKRGISLLWLELGLQSISQVSLDWMNRKESVEDFEKAMDLCRSHAIPVVAHIILGAPGEGSDHLRRTAHYLNQSGVWGLKIHQLHAIKGTRLFRLYQSGQWHPYLLHQFLDDIILFLENLRPEIVIHRLVADERKKTGIFHNGEELVKEVVYRELIREIEARDSFQGKAII